MKKLKNPFESIPGYNCFGCSSSNHQGLRMTFYEDGDEVVSEWDPDPHFQGYIDIVHGGIQCTLMDEIGSWTVFVKLHTGGFTTKLTTRFRKPVLISDGNVTIRARVLEHRSRIAEIDVKLYNGRGELCSEALVEYAVLSPEKAVAIMNFPGPEAFYDKD